MTSAGAQQAMQYNISTMQAAVKALEPGNLQKQETAQTLLTFMDDHLTHWEAYLAAAAAAADGQGSSAAAVAQMMLDKVIELRQQDF